MVTRITTPISIARALRYNEQKVEKAQARLLHASGFLKEATQLTYSEILRHFEKLTALNERTKLNALHFSINFDPSDRLNQEQMAGIASRYMEKIGFGAQPYLVYQHLDAGHPHLHLVTTNIQHSGKRIDFHDPGCKRSQQARREIEQEFDLVRAEDQQRKQMQELNKEVERVVYGRTETKRGIEKAVSHVLHQYHFTSLDEFNAVLKLYGVQAERGKEHSRIFKHQGLVYRALDEKGLKKGVPLKASSLEGKPTMALLEKKFLENELKRSMDQKQLKTAIDWTLLQNPGRDLSGIRKLLLREQIDVSHQKGKAGRADSLIYIDHRSCSVFRDRDLGQEYTPEGLENRLAHARAQKLEMEKKLSPVLLQKKQPEKTLSQEKELTGRALFHQLLKAQGASVTPPEERLKKKKEQQQNLNLGL
ncbi:relaxase/mobilization nuclease domain-containing protein [Paraflavisolibacter sp. H34]|uniref:relaxase/mobilization nuclease domain-containing protein n=1 Tax=Huijunlia imazamoxiresistens TaxID=3127457 RepID=UPI0030189E1A